MLFNHVIVFIRERIRYQNVYVAVGRPVRIQGFMLDEAPSSLYCFEHSLLNRSKELGTSSDN